ncbi:helix-turn-helix domain-containing protein [Streptomyces sp. NPDC048172]|uniref:helix-turn-helix domain-containing protein n=1 Tax=Streptomyces sp. NPDC048172 TaxID=3365505 RepID=UPI0037187E51
MRTAVRVEAAVAGWDVARPTAPGRVPGVGLAGFRSRGPRPVDVRVVPHPAVTLALECGDGPLLVDTATGRQRHGDLAAGYLHGALRVRGARVECVQIRLSPVVARAVLGVSPEELNGTMAALGELCGEGAVARVRERLAEAASWRERFAVAEEWLGRRADAGAPVDPEVARAWDRIVASRGQARIDGLAAEVGWSRKRLWSRFRSQIGLPPKRAARLVRFDRAAHRLAAGEGPVTVAADGGYVDQSHLHRDVVAFSGVTPAAVVGGPWMAVDDLAWA